jgi:hypothetical protein
LQPLAGFVRSKADGAHVEYVVVRQPAGDYEPGQVKSLRAAIEQK